MKPGPLKFVALQPGAWGLGGGRGGSLKNSGGSWVGADFYPSSSLSVATQRSGGFWEKVWWLLGRGAFFLSIPLSVAGDAAVWWLLGKARWLLGQVGKKTLSA